MILLRIIRNVSICLITISIVWLVFYGSLSSLTQFLIGIFGNFGNENTKVGIFLTENERYFKFYSLFILGALCLVFFETIITKFLNYQTQNSSAILIYALLLYLLIPLMLYVLLSVDVLALEQKDFSFVYCIFTLFLFFVMFYFFQLILALYRSVLSTNNLRGDVGVVCIVGFALFLGVELINSWAEFFFLNSNFTLYHFWYLLIYIKHLLFSLLVKFVYALTPQLKEIFEVQIHSFEIKDFETLILFFYSLLVNYMVWFHVNLQPSVGDGAILSIWADQKLNLQWNGLASLPFYVVLKGLLIKPNSSNFHYHSLNIEPVIDVDWLRVLVNNAPADSILTMWSAFQSIHLYYYLIIYFFLFFSFYLFSFIIKVIIFGPDFIFLFFLLLLFLKGLFSTTLNSEKGYFPLLATYYTQVVGKILIGMFVWQCLVGYLLSFPDWFSLNVIYFLIKNLILTFYYYLFSSLSSLGNEGSLSLLYFICNQDFNQFQILSPGFNGANYQIFYSSEMNNASMRSATVLCYNIIYFLYTHNYYGFFLSYVLTHLTNPALIYSKAVCSLIGAIVLFFSGAYLKLFRLNSYEFAFIISFLVWSSWMLLSTTSWISLYLLLEFQALSFFLLIAWKRTSILNINTALKYGVVNMIASSLILYGLIHIILMQGHSNIIYTLCQQNFHLINVDNLPLLFLNNHFQSIYSGFLKTYLNYREWGQPDIDLSKRFFQWHYTIIANSPVLCLDMKFQPELWSNAALTEIFQPSSAINTRVNFFLTVIPLLTIKLQTTINVSVFLPLLCLLFGFLIKIGVAPFAFWVPEIYAGITLPVLILFSTLPKFVYVFVLINIILAQFYYYGLSSLYFANTYFPFLNNLFFGLAILSAVVGAIGIIKERQLIARFLGWSSISNFGLFCLVFSYIFSIDFTQELELYQIHDVIVIIFQLVLFYLFYYNIQILFFLGAFSFVKFSDYNSYSYSYSYPYYSRPILYYSDLSHVNKTTSFMWLILLIGGSLLSLFGLPPFLGFWGKFVFLQQLIGNIILTPTMWLSLIFILLINLVGSYGYLRLFQNLIFNRKNYDNITIVTGCILGQVKLIVISFFFFCQVLGFLASQWFFDWFYIINFFTPIIFNHPQITFSDYLIILVNKPVVLPSDLIVIKESKVL